MKVTISETEDVKLPFFDGVLTVEDLVEEGDDGLGFEIRDHFHSDTPA